MKKFMGLVFLVAIFSMVLTIISFIVFDLPQMGKYWWKWEIGLGPKIILEVEESIKDAVTDGIADSLDGVKEGLVGGVRESIDDWMRDWSEDLTYQIARQAKDNQEDDELSREIHQEIYQEVLSQVGAEDGYFTRDIIRRGRDHIIQSWTQEVGQISSLEMEADNLGLIMGKTRGQKLEFFLTCSRKDGTDLDLTKEVQDKQYRVKINTKNHRAGYNYSLFVLVPDTYLGQVNLRLDNGVLIGISQERDLKAQIANGIGIIKQTANCNLDIKIQNGNIIVDLYGNLDAKLNAKTTNGAIIGLANGFAFNRASHTYGSGKASIDLETINGNIIGSQD